MRRWDGHIGTVHWASPRGLGAVLLYTLTAGAIFAGPVILLIQFAESGGRPSAQSELTLAGLLLNLLFNIAVLLVLPLLAIAVSNPHAPGSVLRRLQLDLRARSLLNVLLGGLAAVVALIVLGTVIFLLQQYANLKVEESELLPQIQALLSWPLVLLISLVAGVTEEVYFRGLLQPRIGLVVSSLLFGFIHIGYGTPLQVIVPMLLGAFFGVLFRVTKSLWAPIAAHFTFDFIELSALLLTRP